MNKNSKEKIFYRDGQRCFYCKKMLTLETFTVDHIVPKCKGGSNKPHNLAASCKECNATKSGRDAFTFLSDPAPKREISKRQQKMNAMFKCDIDLVKRGLFSVDWVLERWKDFPQCKNYILLNFKIEDKDCKA